MSWTFERDGKLVARGEGGLVNPESLSKLAAVQRKDWPLWAKALKQFATPNDKGIGDVVARMIGDENSTKFKAWHLATFGRPCGCNGRQERWNRMYPLT